MEFKPREHLPIVLAVLLVIFVAVRLALAILQVPNSEWIEDIIDKIGLLLGMAVAYFFKGDSQKK
ncbi:MAG: hypothetical protein PHQ80_03480 [Candidatus ainarchaeum sp.]|nr:hypothetical protein [Candidatus ainarchaeum sp.]